VPKKKTSLINLALRSPGVALVIQLAEPKEEFAIERVDRIQNLAT
jgi:hypothetical protein